MYLCFILVCALSSTWAQESMGTLLLYEDQKEVPLEDINENWNFLTLKEQIHKEKKTFQDVTVCFRFNLLSYRGESKTNFLIHAYADNYREYVKNTVTGVIENGTDRFLFYLNPVTPGNGRFDLITYIEKMPEVTRAGGQFLIWPIYKEEINANQWNSMCMGSTIDSRIIYMVHNGKTQENITQPEVWADVSKPLDTSMFDRFKTKYKWNRNPKEKYWTNINNAHWSGQQLAENKSPFSGYFTDYQIFGRSLTTQEMYDITSCKSFPEGDIYSWDADDWEPYDKELQKNEVSAVQYRRVDVERKSLCKATEKYTFFPDQSGFKESLNLCRRFGGRLADASTSKKSNAVAAFLGTRIKENPKYDDSIDARTYSSFTDEEELNVWVDFHTGKPAEDPLNWNGAEPNGGMVENCNNLLAEKDQQGKYLATYIDVTCPWPVANVCEDIGDVIIKFRGLCKASLIDTTYIMVEGDVNKKRFFAGNTGWRIYWDDDMSLWKLGSPPKKNMVGFHSEFQTYPLGKNYWKIVNDTRCVYPNPDKILINMSPCNSSSFTCDDGTCIQMTGR